MTPHEFIADLDNQIRFGIRQWDVDNDLIPDHPNNIAPTTHTDSDGNQINASCWVDEVGTFYAGYFVFTAMRETYCVVFRQCPFESQTEAMQFSLPISAAAVNYEREFLLTSSIN